jgi:peroxin-5
MTDRISFHVFSFLIIEWQEEYMQREHVVGDMPAEFEAAFQKNFDWANEFALVEGKGKGRAVDANQASWEAQFEAAQRDGEATTANPINFDEHEQLEDLWNTLKDNLTDSEDVQNILDDPSSWETEFSDLNAVAAPQLGPYQFEPNNHYLTHPDPMTEGIRLTEEGGSLSEAALAFEAAVQQDDSNSRAWMMLGNVQAQNEKEEPAIRALERAVQVDANNLDAYMVSNSRFFIMSRVFVSSLFNFLTPFLLCDFQFALHIRTSPSVTRTKDMTTRLT